MIEIRLENAEAFHAAIDRIRRGLVDTTPLMRALAGTLADETEANFAAEGRPAWLGIQPRPGRAGGRILQDTGRLAASVTSDYDAAQARIGSNLVYAAIHQFGGQTRPHEIKTRRARALHFGGVFRRRVQHPGSAIPARPYLPLTADGQRVQPEAEAAIQADVQDFLRRLTP